MKNSLKYLLVTLLSLSLVLSFTACNSGNSSNEEDQIPENDKTTSEEYIDEEEGVVVEKTKTNVSKFYGKWVAESYKAEYLYGKIEIEVNEDGTWTANISGEDLGGHWEDKGDYIRLNEEKNDGLFSFNMALSSSGQVVFIDDENEEDINIVLTKK